VLTKKRETQFSNKKQTEFMMHLKMGKRIHLCEYEADSLAEGLNGLFNRYVDIPRIKHGKRQTLDTLLNEEALLLANFLRKERMDSENP
jgi:hypothetical protein